MEESSSAPSATEGRQTSDTVESAVAIGTILALSVSLVPPQAEFLFWVGLVVLGILLAYPQALRRAARLIHRLKWFFISLLLFFGWFPVDGGANWQWLPSWAGLGEAGLRIAALALLVAWIAWVLQVFDRSSLIGGLRLWLFPLRGLGISGERFARLLFLAIAYAEQKQDSRSLPQPVQDGTRMQRWYWGREQLIRLLQWALSAPPPPITHPDPAQSRPVGEDRSWSRCRMLRAGAMVCLGLALLATGIGFAPGTERF